MLATILPQAAQGSTIIVDANIPAAPPPVAERQTVIEENRRAEATTPASLVFEVQPNPAEFMPPQAVQTAAPINGYSQAATEERLEAQPEIPAYSFAPAAQAEAVGSEEDLARPSLDPYAEFYYQTEEKVSDVQIQAEEAVGTNAFSLHQPGEAEAVQPEPTVESHSFHIPQPYKAQEESAPPVYETRFAAPPQEFSPGLAQLEKEPEAHHQAGNYFVVPENQPPEVQDNWQTSDSPPQQFYPPVQDSQEFYPQNVAPLYPQTAQPPYAPESDYPLRAPATDELVNQWDGSMDNYPVLMVQEEKRPLSKALLAVAAIALLALAVAGYFFVYQPYFGSKPATPQQRAGSTLEDTKPAAPPAKPDESAPSAPPASSQAGPASANAATPETPQPTPNEAKPDTAEPAGQGKVSLQAASFPSEQGAKEFSEKLIRSGVPAYIAAADIAGKGRWFRVRVGRFMSAAEAEKYAEQAKQRAKATGVTLQLVICEYSNP